MSCQSERSNAIQILNLPKGSRQVDMAILVAKTHIRPFLRDYWLDTETNIGHLLLRKQEHLSFILFVLQKHFCQADEIPCYFVPEHVADSQRTASRTCERVTRTFREQPRITIFQAGDEQLVVIIMV